jgi:hypothetical protein
MLLYVMSRPHSGSTILDILLGNTGRVASVGQLVSDMGKPGNPCACGASIGDCPFWREVRSRVEAEGIAWGEAVRLSVGQAHVRNFWRTLRSAPDAPEARRLAEVTAAVHRAIAGAAGRPHVLDSSKEPTRALFLARHYPDARLVRLVRDPRSAVASHYWRLKDKGYFHFLRRDYRAPALAPLFLALAAASWTVGNLLHDLAASRAAPGRVVRLRYEDLRDRPAEELGRLGAALGIDVAAAQARVEGGAELEVGHLIGGNDVRLERGLRFEPGREGTRRQPPRWVGVLTVALCWPLMARYGYAARRAPAPRPGAADAAAPAAPGRPA